MKREFMKREKKVLLKVPIKSRRASKNLLNVAKFSAKLKRSVEKSKQEIDKITKRGIILKKIKAVGFLMKLSIIDILRFREKY